MEVEVFGKKYEVLEILTKRHSEHDLFICKSKAGYRECFQRFDIGREPKKIKMSDAVPWTSEENKIINDAIEKGLTPGEVSEIEELNRHTKNAIMTRFCETKRQKRMKEEMLRERRRDPRFNIKF